MYTVQCMYSDLCLHAETLFSPSASEASIALWQPPMRPPSKARSSCAEREELFERRVETHKRVMHAADSLIEMQRQNAGMTLDNRYKQLFGSSHSRGAKSARRSASARGTSADSAAVAPDGLSSAIRFDSIRFLVFVCLS